MRRTTLGRTEIEVSAWCLGTMTWGRQTGEADAHAQIEAALGAGIDFLDTAEMYPVNPVRAETVGDTETILGNWIRRTGRRDEIVVATKCTGPSGLVRDGAWVTPETLRGALHGSLQRLGTDMVDLYQIHWPNRGSYHFRQNWAYDPARQDTEAEIDTIRALSQTLRDLVQEGKIRAFGLSNDTAWGTMQWLRAAEETGGPRPATMQNEYSLLCRLYDTDMAELSVHEDITLFAYSPLAAGLLTGKYQGGQVPDASRAATTADLGGRMTPRALDAVDVYLGLAARHRVDPVHMALAWTTERPMHCVPIFGATDMDQLRHILAGVDVALADPLREAIDAAHRAHPVPY